MVGRFFLHEIVSRALLVARRCRNGRALPTGEGRSIGIAGPVSAAWGPRQRLSHLPFAGRRLVLAGGDVTDEDGFRVVKSLGGYTIHAGEGTDTAARWCVPNVSRLRSWRAGVVLDGSIDRKAPVSL